MTGAAGNTPFRLTRPTNEDRDLGASKPGFSNRLYQVKPPPGMTAKGEETNETDEYTAFRSADAGDDLCGDASGETLEEEAIKENPKLKSVTIPPA